MCACTMDVYMAKINRYESAILEIRFEDQRQKQLTFHVLEHRVY